MIENLHVQFCSCACAFRETTTHFVVGWISTLDGVVATASVRDAMGQRIVTLGTPYWDSLDSLGRNLDNGW